MARSSATLHALSVRFLAKTNGIALNDNRNVFLTPTVYKVYVSAQDIFTPYRVGDHMPDKVSIHLPSMLSRKSVYEHMKQERDDCASLVSQSQFYTLWSQHYPHVNIPAVNP